MKTKPLRLHHLALVWIVLCGLFMPKAAQAQMINWNAFTFTTNGDGTLTIASYSGPTVNVEIPATTTNGLRITTIGDSVFSWSGFTNVTIDEGITSIGNSTFAYCTHLPSISIPGSVTSIGNEAFAGCGLLASVAIPYGVTTLSTGAFESCSSLTTVSIPGSVITIGDSAFENCGLLASVAIPFGVATLGTGAFEGCSSLTSVTIPNSLTSLGGDAFANCSALTNAPLPNRLASIGSYAFAYCSDLKSVAIPSSVTSIGSYAFYACTGLTTLAIPGSVTNIGSGAFGSCHLTNAFFQGNAPGGAGDSTIFSSQSGTAYYLLGTSGWGSTFGGWLTAPLFQSKPQILAGGNGFGVSSNQFSFTVAWATNTSVIIQACTNLGSPVWTPVATNVLIQGLFKFSDSTWTNAPARFYRVRSR